MKYAIRKAEKKLRSFSGQIQQYLGIKRTYNSKSSDSNNSLFPKIEQLRIIRPGLLQFMLNRKPFISNDSSANELTNFSALKRPNDLPSIAEFVDYHQNLFINKSDAKYLFTQDEATLKITNNILNFDPSRKDGLSYILEKPDFSKKDLGSRKILISRLDDFPVFQKIYEENKSQEVLMCVGGPSAQDQAIIATMIPKIAKKLDKIIYIIKDYKESNVAHSAKQYHIRHANALNADPHLTGRHIIKTVIKRLFLGVKEQEVMQSDFLKIDVKNTLDPKILKIYLGNEINAIKQNIRDFRGELTEHDINRIGAFIGGEFFSIIEKNFNIEISGKNKNSELDHPSAIHVTFNKDEAKAAEIDNKILAKISIESKELSLEQIKKFFGEENKIYKAYAYPSDTHIVFDIHEINKNYAAKHDVSWMEGVEVKNILLTQDDDKNPKIAGIIDDKGNFIYANKLHFSGGYKADYVYDNNSKSRFKKSFLRNFINKTQDYLGFKNPLNNSITTATGVSINAILKKTAKFGEISVTNSHWTKIAENDEYMIVRMTGGGNTGSEKYNPSYALNVLANSRRIFGDSLIGVISTYGCSRSVNAKNSTEWAMLAKGLLVSYGKGGTGNTKRHFEAMKALYKLGFAKELVDFCNKYKSERGGPLGNKFAEFAEISSKNFFYDNIKRTKKRMGF